MTNINSKFQRQWKVHTASIFGLFLILQTILVRYQVSGLVLNTFAGRNDLSGTSEAHLRPGDYNLAAESLTKIGDREGGSYGFTANLQRRTGRKRPNPDEDDSRAEKSRSRILSYTEDELEYVKAIQRAQNNEREILSRISDLLPEFPESEEPRPNIGYQDIVRSMIELRKEEEELNEDLIGFYEAAAAPRELRERKDLLYFSGGLSFQDPNAEAIFSWKSSWGAGHLILGQMEFVRQGLDSNEPLLSAWIWYAWAGKWGDGETHPLRYITLTDISDEQTNRILYQAYRDSFEDVQASISKPLSLEYDKIRHNSGKARTTWFAVSGIPEIHAISRMLIMYRNSLANIMISAVRIQFRKLRQIDGITLPENSRILVELRQSEYARDSTVSTDRSSDDEEDQGSSRDKGKGKGSNEGPVSPWLGDLNVLDFDLQGEQGNIPPAAASALQSLINCNRKATDTRKAQELDPRKQMKDQYPLLNGEQTIQSANLDGELYFKNANIGTRRKKDQIKNPDSYQPLLVKDIVADLAIYVMRSWPDQHIILNWPGKDMVSYFPLLIYHCWGATLFESFEPIFEPPRAKLAYITILDVKNPDTIDVLSIVHQKIYGRKFNIGEEVHIFLADLDLDNEEQRFLWDAMIGTDEVDSVVTMLHIYKNGLFKATISGIGFLFTFDMYGYKQTSIFISLEHQVAGIPDEQLEINDPGDAAVDSSGRPDVTEISDDDTSEGSEEHTYRDFFVHQLMQAMKNNMGLKFIEWAINFDELNPVLNEGLLTKNLELYMPRSAIEVDDPTRTDTYRFIVSTEERHIIYIGSQELPTKDPPGTRMPLWDVASVICQAWWDQSGKTTIQDISFLTVQRAMYEHLIEFRKFAAVQKHGAYTMWTFAADKTPDSVWDDLLVGFWSFSDAGTVVRQLLSNYSRFLKGRKVQSIQMTVPGTYLTQCTLKISFGRRGGSSKSLRKLHDVVPSMTSIDEVDKALLHVSNEFFQFEHPSARITNLGSHELIESLDRGIKQRINMLVVFWRMKAYHEFQHKVLSHNEFGLYAHRKSASNLEYSTLPLVQSLKERYGVHKIKSGKKSSRERSLEEDLFNLMRRILQRTGGSIFPPNPKDSPTRRLVSMITDSGQAAFQRDTITIKKRGNEDHFPSLVLFYGENTKSMLISSEIPTNIDVDYLTGALAAVCAPRFDNSERQKNANIPGFETVTFTSVSEKTKQILAYIRNPWLKSFMAVPGEENTFTIREPQFADRSSYQPNTKVPNDDEFDYLMQIQGNVALAKIWFMLLGTIEISSVQNLWTTYFPILNFREFDILKVKEVTVRWRSPKNGAEIPEIIIGLNTITDDPTSHTNRPDGSVLARLSPASNNDWYDRYSNTIIGLYYSYWLAAMTRDEGLRDMPILDSRVFPISLRPGQDSRNRVDVGYLQILLKEFTLRFESSSREKLTEGGIPISDLLEGASYNRFSLNNKHEENSDYEFCVSLLSRHMIISVVPDSVKANNFVADVSVVSDPSKLQIDDDGYARHMAKIIHHVWITKATTTQLSFLTFMDMSPFSNRILYERWLLHTDNSWKSGTVDRPWVLLDVYSAPPPSSLPADWAMFLGIPEVSAVAEILLHRGMNMRHMAISRIFATIVGPWPSSTMHDPLTWKWVLIVQLEDRGKYFLGTV